MTKLFVKQYKKNYHPNCYDCTFKPTEYSMCSNHLERARDQFTVWRLARQMVHLCINCNNKSYKEQLRCSKHRKVIGEYCKAWHIKNKNHVDKYTITRKQYWRKQGLCFKCPEHRQLTNGFLNCQECRTKHQNHKKK